MVLAGGLFAGCGTSLLETEIPADDVSLTELRQGGEAWGCHERSSDIFVLYLECPRQGGVLGVLETDGELGFTCPERTPTECRQFVRDMRRRGGGPPEVLEQ